MGKAHDGSVQEKQLGANAACSELRIEALECLDDCLAAHQAHDGLRS
jgi:hypothetical protein